MNHETRTDEMSVSEIAAELGISERAVRHIVRHALAKLRAQSQIWADFREAVGEKRRALDARPGNGPWHYARPMQLNVGEVGTLANGSEDLP